MGWEGANVIFDTWVHPLMMGLEEHLIGMFREDFEFGEHGSHHGKAPAKRAEPEPEPVLVAVAAGAPAWTPDGEKELKKIPFFVRKKARLNTERFAAERGIAQISVETLYEAKAHYGK
jgi:light-independent protochlorophyllide reductase subunit B